MAYPITDKGVTVGYANSSTGGEVRIERKRSKQAKPYNLPADYRAAWRWVHGKGVMSWYGASHLSSPYYISCPFRLVYADWPVQGVVQIARERFISRLRDRASWSVSLAERHQALSMMADRLTQLYKFTRALRKFRFKEAADILGVRQKANLRTNSRSFSKNFLEWHFGWSPLLNDIWTTCEILSHPVKGRKVSGTANEYFQAQAGDYQQPEWYSTGDIQWVIGARVAAQVRVTNPNLGLLAQMGLTNPLTVAWELVPFSFVVDWFVNVSEFIGQLDEFVGLTIEEPYHEWKVRGIYKYKLVSGDFDAWHNFLGTYTETGSVDSVLKQFERVRGIPDVVLGVRAGKVVSLSRVVTAMALLIQKGIRAPTTKSREVRRPSLPPYRWDEPFYRS